MAKTVECVTCKKMFDPRGIKSHRQTAHPGESGGSPATPIAERPCASPASSKTSDGAPAAPKPAAPASSAAPARQQTSSEKAEPTPGAKPSGKRAWWDPFEIWS